MTARNQSPNDGIVRLRPTGKGMDTGQISVPAYIARSIPWGTRFRAEVTEDGILYRFIGPDSPTVIGDLPAWMEGLQA